MTADSLEVASCTIKPLGVCKAAMAKMAGFVHDHASEVTAVGAVVALVAAVAGSPDMQDALLKVMAHAAGAADGIKNLASDPGALSHTVTQIAQDPSAVTQVFQDLGNAALAKGGEWSASASVAEVGGSLSQVGVIAGAASVILASGGKFADRIKNAAAAMVNDRGRE